METAIESVLVLPSGQKNELFDRIVEFVDSTESYELIEQQTGGSGSEDKIYFELADELISIIFSENYADFPDGSLVRIHFSIGSMLRETDKLIEARPLQQIISITANIYQLLSEYPLAGFGIERYQNQIAPISAEELPPVDRKFLTWLDVFSPEEVERIGRECLVSAPAARVDELDDGGVIMASKHPVTEDPTPLDEVAEHVGIPSWEDYPDERASGSDFDE